MDISLIHLSKTGEASKIEAQKNLRAAMIRLTEAQNALSIENGIGTEFLISKLEELHTDLEDLYKNLDHL